jgi:aminoglycoside 6'-N-acetyltransferase
VIILESARLLLRPFQECDAVAFSAYRSDPDVARYQGWNAPFNLHQADLFIKKMKELQPGKPGVWYQFAIERKGRTGLIGDCALHVVAGNGRLAEVGFTLAREHQRRGYASEAVSRLLDYAFDDLDLHRVIAACDVENVRSAELMKRIGMRQEGHHIENNWFKGRWSSDYLFAVLQHEWRELRKSGISQ